MSAAPAWEPEPLPAPPERHLTVVPAAPEAPDVFEPIDLDEHAAVEVETGGPSGPPPPPRPPTAPQPVPVRRSGRPDDGILIPATLVLAAVAGVTARAGGWVIGLSAVAAALAALVALVCWVYPDRST